MPVGGLRQFEFGVGDQGLVEMDARHGRVATSTASISTSQTRPSSAAVMT
jgi:hypothetical protein